MNNFVWYDPKKFIKALIIEVHKSNITHKRKGKIKIKKRNSNSDSTAQFCFFFFILLTAILSNCSRELQGQFSDIQKVVVPPLVSRLSYILFLRKGKEKKRKEKKRGARGFQRVWVTAGTSKSNRDNNC